MPEKKNEEYLYVWMVAGNTPLRHLVYRVLDLPPSMRPLVYDFGTLEPSTEQYYTGQIVKYHVRKSELPDTL